MMNRFNKGILMILATMLMISVPLISIAQGKGKGDPNHCPYSNQDPKAPGAPSFRMMDFIPDITPEQKAKIEELRIKHMSSTIELKARIKEKEAHLETLAVSEKADKLAIESTIDEIFGLRADLKKSQMGLRMDVRALLTPEQRVVFDQRVHGMRGKGPGQNRPGQGPGGVQQRHRMPN